MAYFASFEKTIRQAMQSLSYISLSTGQTGCGNYFAERAERIDDL